MHSTKTMTQNSLKTATHDAFVTAMNDDLGWCSRCQAFTTGDVEPDAENYECEMCGKTTVTGAEQSLLCGFFEVAAQD